jgi:CHAD domain-containing protein
MIEGATALQDLLGEHQDAVVAIEHLRQIAAVRRGSLPSHALFVMGAVAERYAHRAETLRRSFPAAFRRIRGRRWKRMRAALEAAASGAV